VTVDGAHADTNSFIEAEVASQPACWRRAIEAMPEHREELPGPGARVAVVGCGTSLFVARAYAALREAAGEGETDAFPASEFPAGRRYDGVVAISRSGTTSEILDVLAAAEGTPAVAITADGATPIATLATHTLELAFAAERSVVQTRFPTTVLALLRASLGEDLGEVVTAGDAAVSSPLPVAAGEFHQVTFLGRGWAAAMAEEAALKCREAAAFWTESYPAMEYRHGPISVSEPGTVVWMFGVPPRGLAAEVAATGARFVADELDPTVDLIRAQRLAVALARQCGRDPDRPRSLSFSVVLDGEQR
jgi:fructoselysine-6-P-deglycase FrlB-like protein